ncbi:MAG TPA: hypothetical protein VN181_10810, partial [Thermoanaerobaculia bacterium]|nr:hypothetical protein [Thermoanaerobaculia bacterium]
VEPQLIPPLLLVTVPLPVPCLDICSVYGAELNVAVTVRLPFIVTVQAPPLVLSHPLQLLKVEPDAAEAVSVTGLPFAYVALQDGPQLIPAGALEIVPEPVPAVRVVNDVHGPR